MHDRKGTEPLHPFEELGALSPPLGPEQQENTDRFADSTGLKEVER